MPRLQGSFHPRLEGYQGEAAHVADRLGRLPWPATPQPTTVEPTTVEPTATGPQSVARSVTSLVMDTSSSMEESAGTGSGRKIDAASRAGQDVVGLAEAESAVGGAHGAGLVEFSSSANVITPMTTDLASLRSTIAGLVPQNRTNIGAGLDLGIQQLTGGTGQKTLVLLSDGKTNEGLSSAEILSTMAPRARAEGIKIYAIGFGSGDEIDESLLRSLASVTGGEYSLAQTPIALRGALMEARYASLGTIVARTAGQIAQGQSVNAATFSVPAKKKELHVALAWPGSDLDAVLVDPKGRSIDERYKGARLFREQNPEIAIIEEPEEGDWELKVQGKDVPGATEDYVAVASTRGVALVDPAAGPGLLLPLLSGGGVLTLLGGGAGYAVVRRRRRRIAPCPRCGSPRGTREKCPNCDLPVTMATLDLRVLDGVSAGAVLQLQSGEIIGRGEGVNHWLGDETVSRQHAQVVWGDGAWAIVDMNSTSGTYRNGEAVMRAHLAVGDLLTLGDVSLRVERAGHG